MNMTSLEALHKSMLTIPTDVQQFPLRLGATEFSCLFTTRTTERYPHFGLSLTSKGANPKFILFDVKPGYYIPAAFDNKSVFKPLCEALRTHGKSGKLYPKEFLTQLNNALPTTANVKSVPTTKDIVVLRPDITEERDKVHFWYWKPWPRSEQPGPPTAENKHKTLMLLGEEALNYSERTNSSSCWTTDETKAKNWKQPSS